MEIITILIVEIVYYNDNCFRIMVQFWSSLSVVIVGNVYRATDQSRAVCRDPLCGHGSQPNPLCAGHCCGNTPADRGIPWRDDRTRTVWPAHHTQGSFPMPHRPFSQPVASQHVTRVNMPLFLGISYMPQVSHTYIMMFIWLLLIHSLVNRKSIMVMA